MPINCSIVLYRNTKEQIQTVIECCLSIPELQVILIDNSPTDYLKDVISDSRILYFHRPDNPGFGAAHNIAFNISIKEKVKYHFIINPDIHFDKFVMHEIIKYCEQNQNVGAVMPKVVFPDGRIQRLAKLIPSPLEYFARRFIPITYLKKIINNRYELKNYDYSYILDAPFLSGCFLCFRTDVIEQIKGFDERIFLYFEDNDICRKILNEGTRTIVYPFVYVTHDHVVKSFFNLKNIMIYFKSGIFYFNKWGWLFDKDRGIQNRKVLRLIKSHQYFG